MAPAMGPEKMAEKSATRTPVSGPVRGWPNAISCSIATLPSAVLLNASRVEHAWMMKKWFSQLKKNT
jgi:hypothetical protein